MSVGYGEFDMSCPKNEAGHEFEKASLDGERHCLHCGRQGRDDARTVSTSFMDEATAARAEFFGNLRSPLSAHGTPRPKR